MADELRRYEEGWGKGRWVVVMTRDTLPPSRPGECWSFASLPCPALPLLLAALASQPPPLTNNTTDGASSLASPPADRRACREGGHFSRATFVACGIAALHTQAASDLVSCVEVPCTVPHSLPC